MKAFPLSNMTGLNQQGMDLRDYFAAKVMPEIYAAYHQEALTEGWEVDWKDRIAKTSYELSDAMIKAREK